MAKNVAMPDGSVVEFPDTMSDDDIGTAIKKNGIGGAQASDIPSGLPPMPKAPNPILSAPEESGLTSGPLLSPNPDENDQPSGAFSTNPLQLRALAREANSAKNTIASAPGAILHALTDPKTPDEPNLPGHILPALNRLAVQPTVNAAKWYSDAAQGKVPNALDQALSVAPEAVGSGAGNVLLGKVVESAKVPDVVSDYARESVPARIMNSALRTRPKGYNYGRDPGAGVVAEGLTGITKQGLLDNISGRLADIGDNINTHLSDPAVNKPVVDISTAVTDPLNTMEAAAIKGKKLDLANRLADLRSRLTNDYARNANGDLVSTGPTKLTGLTPREANAIKQDIGEMAKWTGKPEVDELSPAVHQIYRGINDQIEQAAPGIKDINQRYGELKSAQDSLDNSIRLHKGYNPLGSLTDILSSMKWGPTGYLASKAARSTPGLTFAAKALKKSTVPQPLQNAAAGLTVANLKQKAQEQ